MDYFILPDDKIIIYNSRLYHNNTIADATLNDINNINTQISMLPYSLITSIVTTQNIVNITLPKLISQYKNLLILQDSTASETLYSYSPLINIAGSNDLYLGYRDVLSLGDSHILGLFIQIANQYAYTICKSGNFSDNRAWVITDSTEFSINANTTISGFKQSIYVYGY